MEACKLQAHDSWRGHRIRCRALAALVGCGLMNIAGPLRAVDVPPSLTFEKFVQLEPPDQRAIISNAIGVRLAVAENLQYVAETTFRFYEYGDGKIGEPLADSTLRYQKSHRWKLGNSYRIDTTRPADLKFPDPFNAPMEREFLQWDNSQGVARVLVRYDGSESLSARIDSVGGSVGESDRFQLFVCGGARTRFGQFLLPQVISHEDDFSIQALESERLVEITLPWKICDDASGSRSIILDCEKGFLPIRGFGNSKSGLLWQIEGFSVLESHDSDGFWYPVRMREYIVGPGMGPEVADVYDTCIAFLESGKVTLHDLTVTFPTGTRVIDAIKGVDYKVGDDGEPLNVESLIGSASGTVPRNHQAASGWQLPSRLLVIALNIAALVAIVIWVKMRRGSRSS